MTTSLYVERIRIDEGAARRYVLTVGGREVAMAFRDLTDKRRFRTRTLEAIDRLVDPPPVDELNRLLAAATEARKRRAR